MSIAGSDEKSTADSGAIGPNCGSPSAELAHLHRLLEAWHAAKRDEMTAQGGGDLDATYAAGWEVTDRMADILRHKEDAATVLAMRLRWLAELHPDATGPLRELGDRIAELKELFDSMADRITDLEAALAEAVTA